MKQGLIMLILKVLVSPIPAILENVDEGRHACSGKADVARVVAVQHHHGRGNEWEQSEDLYPRLSSTWRNMQAPPGGGGGGGVDFVTLHPTLPAPDNRPLFGATGSPEEAHESN